MSTQEIIEFWFKYFEYIAIGILILVTIVLTVGIIAGVLVQIQRDLTEYFKRVRRGKLKN